MKSVFEVFRRGLQRTKTSLVRRIQTVFSGTEQWDEDSYEELEAALISTDLGVEISSRIVDDVRERYERGLIDSSEDIMAVAREDVAKTLAAHASQKIDVDAGSAPKVILVVGVNGSGKTTTAAKLAHQWQQEGCRVMLAAADTYRAAGVEQLKIWADRVGCEVVGGKKGGDSAAVAYDAVTAARSRDCDVVIIDTAGRQHTRKGLMDELEKIRRTLDKACPGAPHEVLLTVDASTGTNALFQAREFGRKCAVTGLVLTKLDGTGKGGVVVAIQEELDLPVFFVGLGEQLDDLQPFEPDHFARALFE